MVQASVMRYGTLITADQLAAGLADPQIRVFDCRFSLADPQAGRSAYARGHIPGAIYADLDRDLSGPVVAGKTGRHPLPAPEAWAATLGTWGVLPTHQLVAYDDAGGAVAARLWWLMRFVGHRDVAVLDGGLQAWLERGGQLEQSAPQPAKTHYPIRPQMDMLVDSAEVGRFVARGDGVLLDARSEDRFRGENETLDPIAGHIPGARSLPFAHSLDAGRFRDPAQLRQRFEEACAGVSPERCIAYCGSGVTACHLILAASHAGLEDLKLYPGSWSEWITDPARPVAMGPSSGSMH